MSETDHSTLKALCRLLSPVAPLTDETKSRLTDSSIWQEIIAIASADLVLPSIFPALQQKLGTLEAFDKELIEYLEAGHAFNQQRNDSILQQLLSLAPAFAKNQHPTILLKGACHLFSTDRGFQYSRVIGDIDLLLHADDLYHAVSQVISQGYQNAESVWYFDHDRTQHYPPLFHPKHPAMLELHEHALSQHLPGQLRYSGIAQGSKCIDGLPFYLPSATFRIIHNMSHALVGDSVFYRSNFPLRHLHDFSVLSQAPSIHWAEVQAQFTSPLRREMLAYYLHLAEEYFTWRRSDLLPRRRSVTVALRCTSKPDSWKSKIVELGFAALGAVSAQRLQSRYGRTASFFQLQYFRIKHLIYLGRKFFTRAGRVKLLHSAKVGTVETTAVEPSTLEPSTVEPKTVEPKTVKLNTAGTNTMETKSAAAPLSTLDSVQSVEVMQAPIPKKTNHEPHNYIHKEKYEIISVDTHALVVDTRSGVSVLLGGSAAAIAEDLIGGCGLDALALQIEREAGIPLAVATSDVHAVHSLLVSIAGDDSLEEHTADLRSELALSLKPQTHPLVTNDEFFILSEAEATSFWGQEQTQRIVLNQPLSAELSIEINYAAELQSEVSHCLELLPTFIGNPVRTRKLIVTPYQEKFAVLAEDRKVLYSPNPSGVVSLVYSQIQRLLAEELPHEIALHGGAFLQEIDPATNEVTLLLGSSGKGKSTLLAHLKHQGFTILSDDLILLTKQLCAVYSLPIPFSVKQGAWSTLKITGDDVPHYLHPRGIPVRYFPVGHSLSTRPCAEIARIVFPHFDPLTAGLVEELSNVECLTEIGKAGYYIPGAQYAERLRQLITKISQVPCARITYSSLSQAQDLLSQVKKLGDRP